MKRKVLGMLLALAVIVQATPIFAISMHFSSESAAYLAERGYLEDTTTPNDPITRSEFVSLTNRVFEKDKKAEEKFNDIIGNEWYADDFLIAKGSGYLFGDDKNNARPNGDITRAEVCAIISCIMGIASDKELNFTDKESIPAWAKKSVGAMSEKGFIVGYSDGSFKANNSITRGEIAVILKKVLEYNISIESTTEIITETTSETTTIDITGGGTVSDSDSGDEETTQPETDLEEYLSKDTDGDGLSDYIEEDLGYDPLSPDIDGDGLLDGFEFFYTLTDVLLVDTDGNGTTDANEDEDQDRLTNIEEQENKSNPMYEDSDEDEILDYDEVKIYKTNPNTQDTDFDDVFDKEELKFGLDPLNPKTDGVTPEGERKFYQTASDTIKLDYPI